MNTTEMTAGETVKRNSGNSKLKNMEAIFNPRSVAVVGASHDPGKLGFHVLKSLTDGEFGGRVFPINPKRGKIMGLEVHASLKDAPDQVDLAVIIVPAPLVPDVIGDCIEIGVKGIVMITGGFKEVGDENGAALQERVASLANGAGIPIIGPNTFGILNLGIGLNATFTPDFSRVKKGNVALISQSGGVSHIIGYLSIQNNVGLGKIMGLGNRCNIDFADALGYLMRDPDTEIIAMYMEGVDDPRKLIRTARKYQGKKPVVALKSGRAALSNKASFSHTGSLAGSHEIYKAAFRQGGILSVDSLEELVDTVKILSSASLPEGGNLAIVSGQAGPAMIACDMCEGKGLSIRPFNHSLQKRVNEILPPLTMRSNPVDLGPAWYDLESLKKILKAICEDEDIAAVLLIIVFGEANRGFVKDLSAMLTDLVGRKPVVGCFSFPLQEWGEDIAAVEDASSFVNYPTPGRAAAALANLWRAREIKMAFA